jgi:hypothetical protein
VNGKTEAKLTNATFILLVNHSKYPKKKNTQVMLLTGQISNSQQIKQQTTMAFQPESKKLAEVVRLN